MNTDNMEQKRQECIYELIYTEEDFAKDMQYIKEVIKAYDSCFVKLKCLLVLDQTIEKQ